MRFEAYDAKSNPAAVAQYQQKCQELANSYMEKRRSLLNPTMEMKETLYKIYKKEPLTATTNMTSSLFGQQQTSNIFGSMNSTNQQTKSIFGGSNTTAVSSTGSSIFGGKPTFGASANLFGSKPANASAFSSTSSIFGGSGQPQQQQAAIFGTTPSSGSSLFGQSNSTTTASGLIQPSMFSTSTQSQQSQPTASIFGNPATAASTTAGQPSGGLFGGTASTNSTSLFGQPPQFSSPVQGTVGGLFGQPAPQTLPTANLFGQTQPITSQQTNVFGTPSQSSVTTTLPAAAPTNLFGQPLQPTASSTTSSTSQSMFVSQPTFGQTMSPSIFGTPATGTTTHGTNVFSQPITTAIMPIAAATQDQSVSSPFAPNNTGSPMAGLFGQGVGGSKSDTTTGLFGKTVEKQKDSSVYTPMHELTQEEIDIYRTCNFVLGKIPEKPPPVELC